MKFHGIDLRQIKCSDKNPGTIQAGISFDVYDNNQNVLLFHFLELIDRNNKGILLEKPIIHQVTKSMYLDKENTKQLIKELKSLKF